MKVGIHQPNFIPWLGYFAKMAASDTFIFLDDVQYTKNSFINRNRIRIGKLPHWVTIPVRGSSESQINEIEIDNTQNWKRQHLKTFKQYYQKRPGFFRTNEMLEEVYAKEFRLLGEFNIELITRVASALGITPTIARSSALALETSRTERLVDLTKQVGGDVYLSGSGGQSYQEEAAFSTNNIKLVYLKIHQAEYGQQGEGFVSSLSVLDYLFNSEQPTDAILKFELCAVSEGWQ